MENFISPLHFKKSNYDFFPIIQIRRWRLVRRWLLTFLMDHPNQSVSFFRGRRLGCSTWHVTDYLFGCGGVASRIVQQILSKVEITGVSTIERKIKLQKWDLKYKQIITYFIIYYRQLSWKHIFIYSCRNLVQKIYNQIIKYSNQIYNQIHYNFLISYRNIVC